jgi:hypothetical protein
MSVRFICINELVTLGLFFKGDEAIMGELFSMLIL